MTAVVGSSLRFFHNELVPISEIPVVDVSQFRLAVIGDVEQGGLISALFGVPQDSGGIRLYGVISLRDSSEISVVATDVDDRYPSLTADCSQAHMFEREIAEQWGVIPEGHPWLKPVRFHASYRPGHDAWSRSPNEPILPCVQPKGTSFYRVEGEEIHEVAVGPVHAGVIEPGHFRFQCHGETVFNLEIALGYQHRGIEKALWKGPDKKTIHLIECLAGDTSVGHSTAYCQAIETLSGASVPLKAQALRGVGLELERMANHTGDLGALAGDIGYLPTMSYCGRIRGDFLNSTAALCGNRFGRSLVKPGGVTWDADAELAQQVIDRVKPAVRDVIGATDLLWDSRSVESRFDGTGTVSRADAEALGLVGMAARASGIERDARHDFPTGIYRFSFIPISTRSTGDVYARALIRTLEVQRSAQFVIGQLEHLPDGPIKTTIGPLKANSFAVSLVEGWRGEICHVALTNSEGSFAHYKVVDPSFHNWNGLAMSLRDQQISDFPLCNKSFNLSYCGHDL